MNTSEFVVKASSIHNNFYLYSDSVYINNNTELLIKCLVHGNFKQTPAKHLKGAGCPRCNKFRKGKSAELKKLLSSSRPDLQMNLDDVQNRKSTVIVTCDKHGDYSTSVRQLLKGSVCLKCHSDSTKRKYLEYKLAAEKLGYKLITTKISNNKQRIVLQCPTHGNYSIVGQELLRNKTKCFKCSNNVISADEFFQESKRIHNEAFDYKNSKYTNKATKIAITCKKCELEFLQHPHNHLNGSGCPYCNVSSNHKKIYSSIATSKNDLLVENNNRTILNGLEIDLWIPEKNFGIEIHGCYWHSCRSNNQEKHLKYKKLHAKKAEIAQQKSISLYQFWCFEIDTKFKIVSSMINNKLGLSKKTYARKCDLLKITNKQAYGFFDRSHLQGHRNARSTYALVLDGEIQCAASFSKHPKHEWEVIRYANSLNLSVVGGFARLLKAFIKEEEPQEILTFADRRFSCGNLYLQNDFELIDITKPNYFYYKRGLVLSRQKCQKKKLPKLLGDKFLDRLSERENMISNEYFQIFDAGNCKMLWTK